MTDLVLYRFFDAEGGLLYIGKSVNAWHRFSDHRRSSTFYPEAASITLQRGFSDEVDLIEAEAAAIRAEQPRYNVNHNREHNSGSSACAAVVRLARPSTTVPRSVIPFGTVADMCKAVESLSAEQIEAMIPVVEGVRSHYARRNEDLAAEIRALGYEPLG
ncbi:GIY-YIG nuclease family protein [Mycolicibacterium conceptionense]|uniref:hypothetical protein n=1 Tax=Mycolicibacterium conceptionense TaxID=451644 RepID=UPI00096E472E|nr:hypothetical protein [Mycolicibacterium conceptionense]OMB79266.1 hypothetical protein A5743_14265 [Mycolicibacterium conceptionense]